MQPSRQDLGVGLTTRDAESARRLYAEVLEMREESPLDLGEATRYRFRAGGNRLDILEHPSCPLGQRGGIYSAVGIRVLAFFVDEPCLERACATLRERGARPVMAPGEWREKDPCAFFADPDGNWLQVAESSGAAREAG